MEEFNERNYTTLATAGPYLRHPDTNRPIDGSVNVTPFGDDNWLKSADSVNRGFGTILHEFLHVIAFIGLDKYHNYIELRNNRTQPFWTGPKVVSVARKHYNCGSLTGVPIQNLNGRVGGHWAEAYLSNELMTPVTGADPEVMSALSLALIEDTRWYRVNYKMAERYTYNKGAGCYS